MSDELNQVQDENIFADAEISNEENLFEDAEETTETSENTAEPEVPKSFLRVKYNGEERDLNEEDARTYAQKGMNYDKFYAPLERLAKLNQMSVSDYLNQLNDTQFEYEKAKEVDKLRDDPKYEGVSDEILEEIASSRVSESIGLRDRQLQEEMKGEADAKEAQARHQLDMFFDEYPEFEGKGPESLDPKVFDYVQKGYTLLEAYNKWMRTDNVQAKTSRQNEANRQKSLGNTTNAGKVETDDFLKGFLEG